MDKRNTEYLFELLDPNYQHYYPDKTFWKELHAIDGELTPGCIRMETFKSSETASPLSDMAFHDGEKTVVMQLQTAQTAKNGARLLNHFFKGTGIWFVAEQATDYSKHVHQIRSNIDKPQWAKLAVFCKYRFSREILKNDEQRQLGEDCQRIVDNYVKDTTIENNKGWKATEGMPAFCSLMGLHGILRPEGHYRADIQRKREELSAAHPHGTPLLFRGIPIHVDIDRHGTIKTTPYIIGFEPTREALERSVEGGSFFSLIAEALGTNFYSPKLRMANRFLRAAVAVVSLKALLEGKMEPVIIASVGLAGLVVAFVHNKWRIVGEHDKLKTNHQPLLDIVNNQHSAVSKKGADIHERIEAMEKKAFSPEGMSQLENLLRDAGVVERIAELKPSRTDDILAARLGGGFGSLFGK